VSRQRSI